MEWLKKIFSKKKKMDFKDKTLPELQEELSQLDFTWIKGDQMGNIERYDNVVLDENTGMTFVCFKSGGRINIELLSEYLDPFPASKVNYSEPIPVQAITQLDQVIPESPQKSARAGSNQVSSVELEDSPIYTLLKKQKTNWVNVNISLKLNLPSKNLYGILISSFDGAEKEIIDYVTEGIDIEDIRNALGDSISAYYDKKKSSSIVGEKNNTEDE